MKFKKFPERMETLTKAQEKIYKEQLEFYGRRSYKLYEDPNYIPSSDVRKEAFEFLSKQSI